MIINIDRYRKLKNAQQEKLCGREKKMNGERKASSFSFEKETKNKIKQEGK